MEEILAKRDWLQFNIVRHIKDFKREKEKNKKRAFYSNVLVASFGLITTVLLGFSLIIINPYLKMVSIVLSVSITIISTINVFFDFSNLWVRYTMTLNELYEIRDDLAYHLSGKPEKNIKMEELDKFKRKLNKILNDTNKSWLNLRKK